MGFCMMAHDDDALTKLQMLVAHQDKQIEELSDMTSAQWKEIDFLKRKIDALMSRIDGLENNAADDKSSEAKSVSEMAAAEKPPHY